MAVSQPTGPETFESVLLMQLSNEGLTVNGQKNTLPNQTLSEGNASILTLGLADNRYLNKSGGTISGSLTITGSTLTVNGSSVLTEAGGGYVKVTSTGDIQGGGASVTPWSAGIGIGAGGIVSGYRAVGIGQLAEAVGDYSVALGRNATAHGNTSIGIGLGAAAGKHKSIAIGEFATTQTVGSIAIGEQAKTSQIGQVVLGSYNEIPPFSPDNALPTDSLFIVANGTADNARSNALVVRRNGDMEVKGTSLTVNGQQVLTATDKADFVRDLNGSYAVNGAYASPSTSAIAIGHYARAGEYSIALGYHTGMWEPGVSGVKSIAIGYIARAPSDYSVAVGTEMWAAGNNVVAVGRMATTRSDNAVAIGHYAEANQVGQVVLGAFNERTIYSPTSWPNDTIFMLGNGTADDARSNALIVKRNGNMEVKGTSLTVNGAEVLTQAALDDAIEDVNLGTGNYISRNGAIGMIYGTTATAAAHSMALGQNTTASGSQSSSAIGYYTRANQQGTHALGNHVVANRPGQIVLGNYNDYGSPLEGSNTAADTDPVFVIGNGTADNTRKNALVIKRAGAIELTGTSLQYNESNILTEASGNTLYLTQSNASSTYITSSAAASQYQPKLTGTDVYLTSTHLVAIQASIDGKLALADLENILGDLEEGFLSKDPLVGLAYGTGSTAIAETSAVGKNAKANQAGAHAIGNNVVANRPGQVVVGNYNDYGTTEAGSNVESPTDPVFVVGAGKAAESEQPAVRKNALTVKRNGDIEATGALHITGDIKADGVIRVQPAGNLSMGAYQSVPPAP